MEIDIIIMESAESAGRSFTSYSDAYESASRFGDSKVLSFILI